VIAHELAHFVNKFYFICCSLWNLFKKLICFLISFSGLAIWLLANGGKQATAMFLVLFVFNLFYYLFISMI
jgi:hypothetical protein